jgi:L-glyceraldehyde 3-phosphate reductase
LKQRDITEDKLVRIRNLNDIALSRGQTLAQMAIVWLLKDPRVTSVLIGSSSVEQLRLNIESLKNSVFTKEELERIKKILP